MQAATYDVLREINATLGRIAEALQTIAEVAASSQRRPDVAAQPRQFSAKSCAKAGCVSVALDKSNYCAEHQLRPTKRS